MAICSLSQGWADFKENYYDLMDGKSREALKEAAGECVSEHLRLEYKKLPNSWVNTDVYPDLYENFRGEMCKRFWEMYSDSIYLIFPGQAGPAAFSINKMQREHVVPKSWWKDYSKTDPTNKEYNIEYTPAYSDLWNLLPSDGKANNAKSNWPLGETMENPKFNNEVTKVGVPKEGLGDGVGFVFEPADEYKGDFARIYFYVATVYADLPWTDDRNTMYERTAWPTLRPWAVEMLLDWSRRDPVSEKERNRNDAVEVEQGNRNPYVDFPELAEFIWGVRSEQTFYVAEQPGLEPTGPGDTSVDFIESDIKAFAGPTDDGFSILTDVVGLRVVDISGKTVLFESEARPGDSFLLPPGLYIITASSHPAPVKLIIRYS